MSASCTATKSLLSFTDLPKELQIMVLCFLPLRELFHIDEVCRAWIELKQEALKGRHHLYIVSDQEDLAEMDAPEYLSLELLEHVKEEDGVTPLVKHKVCLERHAFLTGAGHLTSAQLDKIIDLMPNVRVLRMSCYGDPLELWKVKCLLIRYQKQLVELSFWFNSYRYGHEDLKNPVGNRIKEHASSILHSINSCTKLRSLDLLLRSPNPNFSLEVHLPIAHRLKALKVRTLNFADNTTALRNLFEREDLNDASSSLEELYIGNTPMKLELAISIRPHLAKTLRQLDINNTFLKSDHHFTTLNQLATRCPNLTDLEVCLLTPAANIVRLAEALVPCTALIHLTINSSEVAASHMRHFAPLAGENAGAAFAAVQPAEPVNQPDLQPKQLPVLPSVKALSLLTDTQSHRDYEKINLATIFPNVQVVFLSQTRDKCPDCPSPLLGCNLLECYHRERASFRMFSKLTRLEVNVYAKNVSFSGSTLSLTRENLDKVIPYEEMFIIDEEDDEEWEMEEEDEEEEDDD